MILDRIDRLSLYAGILPDAPALARMLQEPVFNPDDVSTHGPYEVRHKRYATRADAERLYEVHHHTIDLMVCLEGAEWVHLCDASLLAPGNPLPGGADGQKLLGAPQGSACLLEAGMFLAILPGEAHMVGGHPGGIPGTVDKLVIKLDARAQGDACPCQSECPRHGSCAQCVAWHRSPHNSLPTCLREKGRLLVEKAQKA